MTCMSSSVKMLMEVPNQ